MEEGGCRVAGKPSLHPACADYDSRLGNPKSPQFFVKSTALASTNACGRSWFSPDEISTKVGAIHPVGPLDGTVAAEVTRRKGDWLANLSRSAS